MDKLPSDYAGDPSHADMAELVALCEAYCNGSLDADQAAQLEQKLLNDADSRRFYLAYAGLDATLRWTLSGGDLSGRDLAGASESLGSVADCRPARPAPDAAALLPTDGDSAAPSPGMFRSFFCSLPGILSAVAGVILIGISLSAYLTPRASMASAHGGFATLIRSTDCQWSVDLFAPQPGQRIDHEGVDLVSGVAEIEFDGGARIVLEGPARLTAQSADMAVLHAGKLLAQVPVDAVGLTIDTPMATVVDGGAGFGIVVEPGMATEFHAFEGQMELKTVPGERGVARPAQIAQGSVGRVDLDGNFSVVSHADVAEFTHSLLSDRHEERKKLVSVTTADGHGADAYVCSGPFKESMMKGNFGASPFLAAKSTYYALKRRKTWMRFDLSGIRLPNDRLERVTLRLTQTDDFHGNSTNPDMTWDFEVWGMLDARHSVPWDHPPGQGGWIEGTGDSFAGQPDATGITWANAGGNQINGEGLEGMQGRYFQLLGSFRIVGPSRDGHQIELSTPYLRDFIADDTNQLLTLVILRRTSQPYRAEDTIHSFASKEHEALPPPELFFDIR